MFLPPAKNFYDAIEFRNSLADKALEQKMNQIKSKYLEPALQNELSLNSEKLGQEKIRNKYAEQNALQDLSKGQTAINQIQQQMQYYPQIMQGDIQNKLLMNKKAELENQFYPQKAQSEINSQNALSSWRNMGGAPKGVDSERERILSSNIKMEHPDWDPMKVYQAKSAYMAGQSTFPNGEPLPVPSGAISASLDYIERGRQTTAALNQQRFASTLDSIFQNADKVVPGALRFTGAAGKIKGGVAALHAQRGDNDPDYADYLKFTREIIPSMASEILRTGGANSTDSQKASAIASANPIALDNNPKLAMEQYEFLKKIYRDIGKRISKGPSEIKASLNKSEASDSPKESQHYVYVRDPSTGNLTEK